MIQDECIELVKQIAHAHGRMVTARDDWDRHIMYVCARPSIRLLETIIEMMSADESDPIMTAIAEAGLVGVINPFDDAARREYRRWDKEYLAWRANLGPHSSPRR